MTFSSDLPRVTIGIPTFNRAATVVRAVRSALGQTYPAVEVVVSDNASTDDTGALVTALADPDGRLRYLRQPENVGAIPNFWSLVDAAGGEYFVWLADDDWLDCSYVESCVGILRSEPTAALVAGDAAYYDGDELRLVERATPLLHRTPAARMLAFYATVSRNGLFYGLTRTDTLRRLARREGVASDWAQVADIASIGSVHRAPTVIHRSAVGGSASIGHRHGQFASPIARMTYRQVLDAPGFAGEPKVLRTAVAASAAMLIWLRTAPGVLFSVTISRAAARLRQLVPAVWYRRLGAPYRQLRRTGNALKHRLFAAGQRDEHA
jgi:hypothetical protein